MHRSIKKNFLYAWIYVNYIFYRPEKMQNYNNFTQILLLKKEYKNTYITFAPSQNIICSLRLLFLKCNKYVKYQRLYKPAAPSTSSSNRNSSPFTEIKTIKHETINTAERKSNNDTLHFL